MRTFPAVPLSYLSGMVYRRSADDSWSFDYVSDGCLRVTGYSLDSFQVGGLRFEQIILSEDKATVDRVIREALLERQEFHCSYRITNALGQEKWVVDHGTGVFDADGEAVAIEGYLRDVSVIERTNRSAERAQTLMSALRDVNRLLIKESDGPKLLHAICHALVNGGAYPLAWIAEVDSERNAVGFFSAGLTQETEQLARQRLPLEPLPQCIERGLVGKRPMCIEEPERGCFKCCIRHACGEEITGMTVPLIHGDQGFGVLHVALKRLPRRQEAELNLLSELASDISFGLHRIALEKINEQISESLRINAHKLGGRIRELNCLYAISSLVERPGVSFDEILQGTIEVIPPAMQYIDIVCARIQLDQREYRTRAFKETQWRLASDLVVHGEVAGVLEIFYLAEVSGVDDEPFVVEERALVKAIAERLGRIIEQNRAEQALRASEKVFRDLVENSLVGISIVQQNRVVYRNPEQERLFGGQADANFGAELRTHIHPEDMVAVQQNFQRVSSGQATALDSSFRFYGSEKEVPDKRVIRWAYSRMSQTQYGHSDSVLFSVMDITQLKTLEELVITQDKMTSLGRVATGVAHEIRNPLSGINIYAANLDRYCRRLDADGIAQKSIEQIRKASNKIEGVIQRVMDFAKPSKLELVSQSVNRPIAEAIELCAVALRKNGVNLRQQLQNNLPNCRLDPQLITQVLLNLINNAEEAMRESNNGKKLEVSTRLQDGYVHIAVADSGPGVPLSVQKKIFDPYYTTKSNGTGIGLSLCRRIIHDHGGTLEVACGALGGAEFDITLPLPSEQPA